MKGFRKQLGQFGEKYAAWYLEKKGFYIIDQHVCFWGGEIDIVAQKDDCLHFVEVKTRSSETYLPLEQSLSHRQLHILNRSASNYIAQKNLYDYNWQIDLMALIVRNKKVFKVEYFEDIDF